MRNKVEKRKVKGRDARLLADRLCCAAFFYFFCWGFGRECGVGGFMNWI